MVCVWGLKFIFFTYFPASRARLWHCARGVIIDNRSKYKNRIIQDSLDEGMIVYLIYLVVGILFVAPILVPGLDSLGIRGVFFDIIMVVLRVIMSLIQGVIAQAF